MAKGPETTPPAKQVKPQPPKKVKPHRESRLRKLFSSIKHNLFLALLAGILAFAGAVWGAMFVQEALWKEQTNYDLTLKRIELLERTINLMGKSTAVLGQAQNYSRSFLTATTRIAQDPTRAVSIISDMLKESADERCGVADAHAEFMSLLALNDVFFGERTSRAVRALQEADPWYEADSSLKAELIEAMKADFYHEDSPEEETPDS